MNVCLYIAAFKNICSFSLMLFNYQAGSGKNRIALDYLFSLSAMYLATSLSVCLSVCLNLFALCFPICLAFSLGASFLRLLRPVNVGNTEQRIRQNNTCDYVQHCATCMYNVCKYISK